MADKEELAIDVQGVYKDFYLPHEKAATLKRAAFNVLQGRRNRTVEHQHALEDITFSIKKGEFFGIVGRNGSGKSTLLKILAGIYQPTKGTVSTKGRLVPFIELGVGFNPELTGRENVYLNGALLGFSREELRSLYNEIVAFAELENFMDQKLKNYSSGMQVRLAFSLAIRAEADILLVDEVLAVGDASFQRKCFAYFKQLKKAKKTVVFVSHDMDAVREYCDRAILIDNSKVVLSGPPSKVALGYTKLFSPVSVEDGTDSKHWGSQEIRQDKVVVTPKVGDETTKDLTITVHFTATARVENPVFGFIAKSATGAYLLGTNTKIKQLKTPVYEAGQRGTIKWTMPNIFNDGLYFIDTNISRTDGSTHYDWWEESSRFEVRKTEKTPFPISPPIRVGLE